MRLRAWPSGGHKTCVPLPQRPHSDAKTVNDAEQLFSSTYIQICVAANFCGPSSRFVFAWQAAKMEDRNLIRHLTWRSHRMGGITPSAK